MYWRQAGHHALERWANQEAVAHCHLGNYLQAMTLSRALIDELVGDRLYGQGTMTVVQSANTRGVLLYCLAEQGTFAEGYPYEEEMMRIAESSQHAGTLMRMYFASGRFYLRQGAFDIALSRLECALEYCQVSNVMLWWPAVAALWDLIAVPYSRNGVHLRRYHLHLIAKERL